MMKIKIILLVCCIILGVFIFNLHASDKCVEETSFVGLIIRTDDKVLTEDYFFEILDYGDYVLVPLSALSAYIDFQLDYQRDQELLGVKCLNEGKIIQVDFAQKKYLEYPEWSLQPPIMHEGDFYVSLFLLEHLAGVNTEWNSRRQELIITGKWESDEDHLRKADEVGTIPQRKEEKIKEPTVVGPNFSLGSIQYRTSVFNRVSSTGHSRLSLDKLLNFHGRAGNWAISMGGAGDYDISTSRFNYSLPLLRAIYDIDDRILILGDSKISLRSTIGTKNIRGVYYQYPEYHTSRILAFTSVSGHADPGDKVSLYLNDVKFSEMQLYEGEKTYKFSNVPLRLMRTNSIRVVIDKFTGGQTETIKKIAGSPRILQDGTDELLFAYGLHRSSSDKEWDGQLLGLAYNYSFADSLSFTFELAGTKSLFESSEDISTNINSVMSLAARVFSPIMVAVDWFTVGDITDPQHGGKLSLLHTLEAGHIKGQYCYIPPNVSKGVNESAGKSSRIIGEWDISGSWRVQMQGQHYQSILDMSPLTSENLSLTLRYRDSWRHYVSIMGKLEEKWFETSINNQDFIDVNTDTYELGIEYRGISEHSNIKTDLAYKSSDIRLDKQEPFQIETVDFDTTLSRRLTSSLLFLTNFDLMGSWKEKVFEKGNLQAEAGIRWWPFINTNVIGTVKAEGKADLNTDYEFELDSSKLSFSANHFFDNNISVNFNVEQNWFNYIDQSYNNYTLGVTHFFKDSGGRISIDLGYVSPLRQRLEPQLTAAINLTTYINSNIQIDLEARRNYANLYATEPEDAIFVSVSLGLGFAQGNIHMQRYSDGNKHTSYISGVVFLDENGNEIFDEGEEKLSGITMFLDGRRATTDENGIFVLEYINPGMYEVGFDLSSLSADYSVITDNKVVKIRENENIFLEFGLTMNGSISGQVFFDRNASGTRDEKDEPLQWVGLFIEELGRTVYTRKDGTFYIENLPLGEYNITVIEDTLPSSMKALKNKSFKIDISKDSLDVRHIVIPIVYDFID